LRTSWRRIERAPGVLEITRRCQPSTTVGTTLFTYVVSYTHGKQFQADHRTDHWNLVEPLDYEIDDPLAGSMICRLDEETHSSPAVTNWSTVWSAIGQPPSAFL
jgi:hypothetical protein